MKDELTEKCLAIAEQDDNITFISRDKKINDWSSTAVWKCEIHGNFTISLIQAHSFIHYANLGICPHCNKIGTNIDPEILNKEQKTNTKYCNKCKTFKPRSEFIKDKNSRYGLKNHCRPCLNSIRAARIIIPKTRLKKILNGVKSRAKEKNMPFNLNYEWVEVHARNGCEMTGIPFDFSNPKNGNRINAHAPSVDRINPTKGYTKDNCRMVCWLYNSAKSYYTDKDVFNMAKALIKQQSLIIPL